MALDVDGNVIISGDYNDYGSNNLAQTNARPEGPVRHKTPYAIGLATLTAIFCLFIAYTIHSAPSPLLPPAATHSASSNVYIPPHSVSPRFTGQQVYMDQLQTCFNLSQPIGQTRPTNRYQRAKTSIAKYFGLKQKLPANENIMERDRRWALLYGTGGVGKTQLALKFAEKHSDSFWRIFWVDASSADTMELGLKAIAEDAEAKAVGVDSSATSVLRWLSGTRRSWLLIYDNADGDPDDVEKYLPTGTAGNILFTSRNPNLARFVPHEGTVMEVVGMNEDEATSLLLKWVSPEASSADVQAIARAIVRKLSCLPLAVDQAGAAINSGLCTIDGYLTLYKSRRKDLMTHRSFRGASSYGRAVYTTWDLSYKAIEAGALGAHSFISPDAADSALLIIQTFAFFHSDKIQEEIIKRAAEIDANLSWGGNETVATGFDGEHKASVNVEKLLERLSRRFLLLDDAGNWDPFPFREGIQILKSFSLIKTNIHDNTYSVHPLVHSWSRDRMSDEDRKDSCRSASTLLAHSITRSLLAADYAFRRDLIPHIQSCRAHNAGAFSSDIYSENFLIAYHENGFHKEAADLAVRVLELRQTVLGAEHPHTLTSMADLALAYSHQGRLKEAEELQVRVLKLQQKVLGEEHPDTLVSMGNLAMTYWSQERLKEAEELEVRVLELRLTVSGAEHPDTLTSMANLASTYHSQGRLKEAEELEVRVLELKRTALGAEHPDTLMSMANLASTYRNQGRLKEAEELEVRILELKQAVFGAEHPSTLTSMNNLAVTWKNLGQDHDAEEMMQKVVALSTKVLGLSHPDTVKSTRWLERWTDRSEGVS